MTHAEYIESLVSEYLGNGGLFNPELMDHGKVRDLVIALRDSHVALRQQLSNLTSDEAVERACDAYNDHPDVYVRADPDAIKATIEAARGDVK